MPSRFCIHYVRKSGKPSNGQRTGKHQSSYPSPKKGSTKECANHQTIALISHGSKVMLKILHARLQHYVNQKLPDVQVRFRKGRGTKDQIHWIIEKAREFQKNIYLCFTDLAEAFDYVDHYKLWKKKKVLREMGIPDHLTCLLRNLYADQEATVRTLYETSGSRLRKDTTGLSAVSLFV